MKRLLDRAMGQTSEIKNKTIIGGLEELDRMIDKKIKSHSCIDDINDYFDRERSKIKNELQKALTSPIKTDLIPQPMFLYTYGKITIYDDMDMARIRERQRVNRFWERFCSPNNFYSVIERRRMEATLNNRKLHIMVSQSGNALIPMKVRK